MKADYGLGTLNITWIAVNVEKKEHSLNLKNKYVCLGALIFPSIGKL